MSNPLMQPWSGVHGLPPFADIQPAHFPPAFDAALAQHRAEIDAIATQAEAPSFANTVAAFDASGRQLARLEHLFYTLAASATSPELQAVQRDLAAPLAEHDEARVRAAVATGLPVPHLTVGSGGGYGAPDGGSDYGGGFDGPGEGLMLVHGSVSKALAGAFLERLQRVALDFAQQHLADQRVPESQREGYTLLLAMRDKEDRVRFSGYDVADFRIFTYCLAAALSGIGGALFTLQVGFMSPSFVGIVPSIEMVIFAAVGGRMSLVGAVYGSLLINAGKTFFSESFPDVWLFLMAALFIGVTMAFPMGLAGLWEDKVVPWWKARQAARKAPATPMAKPMATTTPVTAAAASKAAELPAAGVGQSA